jgi:hypothetical protein
VALSVTADLIEGRVDVAAANGVHWGAQLALTTVLLHLPELELELELLGSGYNADLTKDKMELKNGMLPMRWFEHTPFFFFLTLFRRGIQKKEKKKE